MSSRPLQSYKEQASKLAGQIAFLKTYSTRCGQATAADAVQLFGGRGITQSGMGQFIEHVRGLSYLKRVFCRLTSDLPIVLPHCHVRCVARWCGGCAGRPWCPASGARYACQFPVVSRFNYFCLLYHATFVSLLHVFERSAPGYVRTVTQP